MKQVFHTPKAPAPVGPYSQAIEIDGQVFFSGQIAFDPEAGEMVAGDAAAHAEQALKNLGAVLEAAGLSFDDVVKTSVFIVDMAEYPAINAVYASFFKQPLPTRTTVAVASLPRGSLFEVDAIAIRSGNNASPSLLATSGA